jgi:hypothetical protein
MARAALAARRLLDARQGDPRFLEQKLSTARHYAEHVLPAAVGLALIVQEGAESVMASDP